MTLPAWRRLTAPDMQTLRDAAAAIDPRGVAAVARLRRDYPADLVASALDLAAARRKAAVKFPGRRDSLIADAVGVEQASSAAVAAHKAHRYADLLGRGGRVADLCCGIGGDAMAMTDAGLDVLAVDRDPLRAWMARQNAGCPAACADVTRLDLPGRTFHLDPARRGDRGRVFRLADYRPGPDTLRALLRDSPDGGIKLGPGIDLAELDAHELTGEVEFISDAGRLVQAMLWAGRLRRHERCATLIRSYERMSVLRLHGTPGPPPIGPVRRHLFTVDPSVERAGLLGVLCDDMHAEAVHPRLGLLSADRVIDSPWLTGFELLAQMPWRPRRVKQWLDSHHAGIVEVKTRGKAVDPDRAQAGLRGRGDAPFTVFVLRWDQRLIALVTRRISSRLLPFSKASTG